MPISLNDLLVRSDLLGHLGVLKAGSSGFSNLQLALVESFTLNLPLSFKSSDNVLVLPADLPNKC